MLKIEIKSFPSNKNQCNLNLSFVSFRPINNKTPHRLQGHAMKI